MTTLRHLERLWDDRQYAGMAGLLAQGRSDIDRDIARGFTTSVAAAALGVVRLDELGQNARPIAGRLVRALLASQHPDGGWGDVAVTALAIRALRCARGEGLAVARGIRWLADLQQDDGAWPAEPLRRFPADAPTTAFVLLQLGADALFNAAARLPDGLAWLGRHQDQLPAAARRTAGRVAVRRRCLAAGEFGPTTGERRVATTTDLFAALS